MSGDWVDYARRWVPRPARYWLQRFVSLDDVKIRWRARRHPLAGVTQGDGKDSGSSPRIGILKNRAQYHLSYVAACQEMGLAFRVVDLFQDERLVAVHQSGCPVFFAWPDATQRPLASLFKDRCELLERLGYCVYPNSIERWLYEDKVRQRDWLSVNELPHPRTWVFTDRDAANRFAAECQLPIVWKTGFGGAATGVQIVRSRRQLLSAVRQAFGRGQVAGGHDRRDREWGRILLQEHLDIAKEWRMVRIGDSYFGHPKGRLGEFHSGSGRAEWDMPPNRLLDLLHRVTELGSFRSMDVDVFELADGRLLINELQTVFGASVSIDQLRKDGQPGRMIRTADGAWQFEPGDFARNACANERIRDGLKQMSFRPDMGNTP